MFSLYLHFNNTICWYVSSIFIVILTPLLYHYVRRRWKKKKFVRNLIKKICKKSEIEIVRENSKLIILEQKQISYSRASITENKHAMTHTKNVTQISCVLKY